MKPALPLLLLSSACTHSLFSGVPMPDTSRPVVRIQTRGGVEFGAPTADGILFLGRTATEGPCRVLYFLGSTPLEEDGTIEPFGGVFYRAVIDLEHQQAEPIDRELRVDEPLVALALDGLQVTEMELQRADDDRIEGNAVTWPGRDLPAGTPVFSRADDQLRFVGLVAGVISVGDRRYLTHTGVTAMREALMLPRQHIRESKVIHRPDDISVVR